MKHIISACFFLFSLSMFSQKVTVTVDKTLTLKEFFKQIESQTDFKFAFTDEIDTSRKYFSEKNTFQNTDIKSVINELNKNALIQFSITGNNIFVKQKTSKAAKKKKPAEWKGFGRNKSADYRG